MSLLVIDEAGAFEVPILPQLLSSVYYQNATLLLWTFLILEKRTEKSSLFIMTCATLVKSLIGNENIIVAETKLSITVVALMHKGFLNSSYDPV